MKDDGKTGTLLETLSPRKKIAGVLLLAVAGVFLSDPPFLKDGPVEAERTIDSFEAIDEMLAEFEKPTPVPNQSDAPPFDGTQGSQSPRSSSQQTTVAETSALVIPAQNSDVPVQTVSLPETSHQMDLQIPGAETSAEEFVPETQAGKTETQPRVRIRLTGSIFPTP